MTADRYAASGRWVPTQVKGLEKKLKGIATDSISSTVEALEENRTKLAVAQTGYTNAENAYKAETNAEKKQNMPLKCKSMAATQKLRMKILQR